MKKKVLLWIAAIMCVSLVGLMGLAGCGEQDAAVDSADSEKGVSSEDSAPAGNSAKAGEQVEAPYIGYAPLDESTFAMVETFQESYDGLPQVELLSYDAGDNNKAIVRLERAKKDGGWDVIAEQSLYLIDNVRQGYMVFRGDAGEGIEMNTELIDNGSETLAHNRVQFKGLNKKDAEEFTFGSLLMFSSGEAMNPDLSEEELLALEERMDMSSKKVLQMNFGDNAIFEKDGEVYPPDADFDDDAVESNINDIYVNEDGKYDVAYKSQEMVAVTIEFVQDEVLAKAPCLYTENDKDLLYHAGTRSGGLVTLEKSTKDGKWKAVSDEEYLSFISNVREGKLNITGSFATGELMVGTKDIVTSDGSRLKNTFLFTVDDPGSIQSEMLGIKSADGYVDGTKKVILKIGSTGKNAFGDASAAQIYKNKDGQFDKLYQDTMYVLTLTFTE